MIPLPGLIQLKVALIAAGAAALVILGLAGALWWVHGEWEDAIRANGELELRNRDLGAKLDEQNAAVQGWQNGAAKAEAEAAAARQAAAKAAVALERRSAELRARAAAAAPPGEARTADDAVAEIRKRLAK